MTAKVERILFTCQQCGASFGRTPGQVATAERGGHRILFCSRRCLGASRVVDLNRVRRSPSEYATPPVMHGPSNPRWVEALTFACRHCAQPFTKKPWQTKRSPPIYCSAACRDAYRREHEAGSASPYYVGGERTYRGRGWREIRAVVVAEQNGRCAKCRKHVGKSLPVNHIIPFRYFDTPEAANARSNLVGLCQSCHMKAEPRRTELFGRHSRTP